MNVISSLTPVPIDVWVAAQSQSFGYNSSGVVAADNAYPDGVLIQWRGLIKENIFPYFDYHFPIIMFFRDISFIFFG
ncbi:hypothetical protein Nepgr_000601 [Nepenthes gracilis]|uniref:Uncharacterized protein n=1 Tax=Nepenthes gracilis TaxID=150966 RepID=A0AAD3P702_NEPGR|nr:hypothetical protein Nepgr_000601 [Nepenthes gracilis]